MRVKVSGFVLRLFIQDAADLNVMGFQQNAGRILFSIQPLAPAPWHEQTVKSEVQADMKHQSIAPN